MSIEHVVPFVLLTATITTVCSTGSKRSRLP